MCGTVRSYSTINLRYGICVGTFPHKASYVRTVTYCRNSPTSNNNVNTTSVLSPACFIHESVSAHGQALSSMRQDCREYKCQLERRATHCRPGKTPLKNDGLATESLKESGGWIPNANLHLDRSSSYFAKCSFYSCNVHSLL